MLIPEEYGGGDLGVSEASVTKDEIYSTGASTTVCHAQMYTMGAVLRRVDRLEAHGHVAHLHVRPVSDPASGSVTAGSWRSSMKNAERILLASESIGDARWFLEKASAYAREREVFGRPIGDNQAVFFPLAGAYANMRAAGLVRDKAAQLFRRRRACGHGRQHRQAAGLRGRLGGG